LQIPYAWLDKLGELWIVVTQKTFFFKWFILGIIINFDILTRVTLKNPVILIICHHMKKLLLKKWKNKRQSHVNHQIHVKQNKVPTNEIKEVETYYKKKV